MSDIRRETCLIIRKENEYLVGTVLYSTELRWSINKYDAWRTRSREDARKVNALIGGTLMLFNPVVGQIREARA